MIIDDGMLDTPAAPLPASFSSSFSSFQNRKGQPFSDCPLKRNTLSVATMLVADLRAFKGGAGFPRAAFFYCTNWKENLSEERLHPHPPILHSF